MTYIGNTVSRRQSDVSHGQTSLDVAILIFNGLTTNGKSKGSFLMVKQNAQGTGRPVGVNKVQVLIIDCCELSKEINVNLCVVGWKDEID